MVGGGRRCVEVVGVEGFASFRCLWLVFVFCGLTDSVCSVVLITIVFFILCSEIRPNTFFMYFLYRRNTFFM